MSRQNSDQPGRLSDQPEHAGVACPNGYLGGDSHLGFVKAVPGNIICRFINKKRKITHR